MAEKQQREQVALSESPKSSTSFVRQLSGRVLSSKAVALVKEMSYRAIPSLKPKPIALETEAANAPPGSYKDEINAARDVETAAPPHPAAPARELASAGVPPPTLAQLLITLFAVVLIGGLFLGWIPLLVIGVQNLDSQSSSAAAAAMSNATLIANTTSANLAESNAKAMICFGSIWGSCMTMSMIVGKHHVYDYVHDHV